MTLKHAREHGVRDTVELVKGAVADDTVMGYACAGTVLDTGGIADFHVGQRVACGRGWTTLQVWRRRAAAQPHNSHGGR